MTAINYPSPIAENDTIFRQSILQVSHGSELYGEIEKFYHDEMANGFNNMDVINYVDQCYQIIQSLLEINNPKNNPNYQNAARTIPKKITYRNEQNEWITANYPNFDLTPSIMRFYTKAKNLTVLMKSLGGQAVLNATERRTSSRSLEQIMPIPQEQPKGIFGSPQNENTGAKYQ